MYSQHPDPGAHAAPGKAHHRSQRSEVGCITHQDTITFRCADGLSGSTCGVPNSRCSPEHCRLWMVCGKAAHLFIGCRRSTRSGPLANCVSTIVTSSHNTITTRLLEQQCALSGARHGCDSSNTHAHSLLRGLSTGQADCGKQETVQHG